MSPPRFSRSSNVALTLPRRGLACVGVASLVGCATSVWDETGIWLAYSTSWLDDETLLVAGPEWGVAAIDTQGQRVRSWLGPEDEVLSVCAYPGQSRIVVVSARDHVLASNGCVAPEAYALVLDTGESTRLTHDGLFDELLCAIGFDEVWLLSREPRNDGPLMADWSGGRFRSLSIATGTARWSCGSHTEYGAANLAADGRGVLMWPTWGVVERHSLDGAIESTDYPWVAEGRELAIRWTHDVSRDDPASNTVALELVQLASGTARVAFRSIGWHETYDMSLSPDERHLSFVVEDGNRAHCLWIVDCTTMRPVVVELPLKAPNER